MRKACIILGSGLVYLGMLFGASCSSEPDPWSPKTYSAELERYNRDPASLPAEWEKYYVEGQEDESFFFHNDSLDAQIVATFTCGKYADIALDILAEHPRFPMGRTAKVIEKGYVKNPRIDVYRVKAEGMVEDRKVIMDYYVVGENHCVVDLVYIVPPKNYEKGLPDFHACLSDMDVIQNRGR